MHANCICNEYASLTQRHLLDKSHINFDMKLWRKLTVLTLKKFFNHQLDPCTYMEIISGYSGAKRKQYFKAYQNVMASGFRKSHCNVSMFVKPDRYPEDACYEKSPRAIQYRSREFNLGLSRYIKPFEHWFYENVTYGVVSDTRVVAKGLNPYQRASLLLAKADCFRNPRFIMIDHSKFDSTINQTHLRTTHRKYQRLFRSGNLEWFLRAQLVNRGTTKNGIKYIAKGTRMSGDADTGCGNSLINADAIFGFFYYSNVVKYDYLLDGDDAVLILEHADVVKLDLSLFGRMGFETKFNLVEDIMEVEFCQSKIIRAQQPVFMRNPLRAISHSLVSRRYFPKSTVKDWLSAQGFCELSLNQGVPILQEFGYQLAELSKKQLFIDELSWKMQGVDLKDRKIDVETLARLDVERAWGIDIGTQLLLEREDFTSYAYRIPASRNLVGISMRDFEQLYEQTIVSTWARFSAYESLVASSSGSWWCSGPSGHQLLG